MWTIEPPVVLISGEVRGKPNDPDTGEDKTFKALAPDGQVDSRRQSLGMAVLGDDGGDKAARETAAWSGGKPELITSCKQLEVLSGQARIFAKRYTVKPAGLTGQKKKGWSLMQHKTKRALMMGRKMSFSGR